MEVRRQSRFATTMLCFALGLIAAACSEGAPPAPQSPVAPPKPVAKSPAPKPAQNVFLITIDTLRADYLGVYGGPAKTPNIDRLAKNGWHFEDCTSASMLTNPSHVSIMSSLYPRDHGVYDNQSGLGDDVPTLAKAFAKEGFTTAAFIGFPHLNPEVANLGHGFGHISRAKTHERSAEAANEDVFRHIDEEAADKRFVWLHYTDPHAPYHEHEPLKNDGHTPMAKARAVAPGFQRNNTWFKEAFKKYEHVEDLRAIYIQEIEYVDRALGELLQGLKERGLGESVIALTSDHGENMGEHELYFHHGGLYPSATHVPLIISAPGRSSRVIEQNVSTVDIAPTLLAMAGLESWSGMRGVSLVPSAGKALAKRAYVYSEHMMGQLLRVHSPKGDVIMHLKNSKQFPSYAFRAGKVEFLDSQGEPVPKEALSSKARDALMQEAHRYLENALLLDAKTAVAQDYRSLRALGYIE